MRTTGIIKSTYKVRNCAQRAASRIIFDLLIGGSGTSRRQSEVVTRPPVGTSLLYSPLCGKPFVILNNTTPVYDKYPSPQRDRISLNRPQACALQAPPVLLTSWASSALQTEACLRCRGYTGFDIHAGLRGFGQIEDVKLEKATCLVDSYLAESNKSGTL